MRTEQILIQYIALSIIALAMLVAAAVQTHRLKKSERARKNLRAKLTVAEKSRASALLMWANAILPRTEAQIEAETVAMLRAHIKGVHTETVNLFEANMDLRDENRELSELAKVQARQLALADEQRISLAEFMHEREDAERMTALAETTPMPPDLTRGKSLRMAGGVA